MATPISNRPVRVGYYGTGRFAKSTHIPNILQMDGVEITALCDTSEQARRTTAEQLALDLNHGYADGHEMLEAEELDCLYSLASVLAGWDSSRQGGVVVDVAAYMALDA